MPQVTVTINGANDVIYTVNDTVDPSATKSGAEQADMEETLPSGRQRR